MRCSTCNREIQSHDSFEGRCFACITFGRTTPTAKVVFLDEIDITVGNESKLIFNTTVSRIGNWIN